MKHSIIIEAIYCQEIGEYMKDEGHATWKTIEDVMDGSAEPYELCGEINRYELVSDDEVAEIIGTTDPDRIQAYKDADEVTNFESEYEERKIEFFFDVPDEDEKELIQDYESDRSIFESNRNAYYGYCHGNRKEFSKMYGTGDYKSYDEWLYSSGYYTITDYKVIN